MYGNAGTVGLIVPSNNTVVEREFNESLPEQYGVVATRVWNTGTAPRDLASMPRDAITAAEQLGTAQPSVIGFACTSGSFLDGSDSEAELRRSLEGVSQVPVITASSAFIEGLRAVGARSVTLVTPYPEEINSRETRYMESYGINVIRSAGMDIRRSVEIGWCSPDTVLQFASDVDTDETDAVFISCTNLRTMTVIDRLEHSLGKPVISSNQAMLWKCLNLMNWEDTVEGIGSLFHHPAESADAVIL